MDWDSALARPTWESDFSIGNSDSPEPLDLTPGGWRHLELPSLTLSPDATAG